MIQNHTNKINRKPALQDEKYVVAIEIGSSQAKIGVAGYIEDDRNKSFTVYNMKALPTVDSVRYGRIVNIRGVQEVLCNLVDEVEQMYPLQGRTILGSFISIGGRSLKSRKISASMVLPSRQEITEELIVNLQDQALENISADEEIVWVEPVTYRIDNIPNPRPVGSLGKRISGDFTAVICSTSNKDDIIDVLSDRVGIRVLGTSVRPIALAQMLLTNTEKNAGCMLVDFGAETITVSIYRRYALQYLATIPIGSRLLTKDLAIKLALTEEKAEQLKITRGNALPAENEDVNDAKAQKFINDIISARLADIVANIAVQPGLAKIPVEDIPVGIILTGGGSKLRNFARLLQKETGMKVRIATMPHDIVITDSDLSQSQNLDLLALLNEAIEFTKIDPELKSVSDLKTEPEEDLNPTAEEKDDGGINFFDGDEVKIIDEPDSGSENEGFNHGRPKSQFAEHNDDLDGTDLDRLTELDDSEDDNYVLDDYDKAAEKRRRAELKKSEEASKKRKEAQKREAERAKKQKEAKAKESSEKEDAPKRQPSRLIDNIINRVIRMMNESAEDNSADTF